MSGELLLLSVASLALRTLGAPLAAGLLSYLLLSAVVVPAYLVGRAVAGLLPRAKRVPAAPPLLLHEGFAR